VWLVNPFLQEVFMEVVEENNEMKRKLLSQLEGDIDSTFVDVTDAQLKVRINTIVENLTEMGNKMRESLPEMEDDELVDDVKFQKWVICNLIVESSLKDEENVAFNKLLYYIYSNCKHNLVELLDYYGVNFERSNGRISSIQLVVNEYE
jgi:hypothetical protein